MLVLLNLRGIHTRNVRKQQKKKQYTLYAHSLYVYINEFSFIFASETTKTSAKLQYKLIFKYYMMLL